MNEDQKKKVKELFFSYALKAHQEVLDASFRGDSIGNISNESKDNVAKVADDFINELEEVIRTVRGSALVN